MLNWHLNIGKFRKCSFEALTWRDLTWVMERMVLATYQGMPRQELITMMRLTTRRSRW